MDREVVNSGEMTKSLIGKFLFFNMVLAYFSNKIIEALTVNNTSFVVWTVISILAGLIITFFVCYFSTKNSFKEKTLPADEMPIVMKNIKLFFVIYFIIGTIYNFYATNYMFKKSLEEGISSYEAQNISDINSMEDTQKTQYESLKKEMVDETLAEMNKYLFIINIGYIGVYIIAFNAEKKFIIQGIRG